MKANVPFYVIAIDFALRVKCHSLQYSKGMSRMKRHNCLRIFYFLIRDAFLIIFGVCTTILGALVAIIGASDLILGPLSKVRGTFHIKPSVQSIKLTANPFILGAFAIIFGA